MAHHTCHAEGCSRSIPPRMFACSAHWGAVPRDLQRALWNVYREGQERDKVVTRAYLLVQILCRIAIASREGRPVNGLVDELATVMDGLLEARTAEVLPGGLNAALARIGVDVRFA